LRTKWKADFYLIEKKETNLKCSSNEIDTKSRQTKAKSANPKPFRSKFYLSAHGRVDRLIGRICTTKTKVGGDRRQNRRRQNLGCNWNAKFWNRIVWNASFHRIPKNIYQLHEKPFEINSTYSKNGIKLKNKSFVKSFPFVPYQK